MKSLINVEEVMSNGSSDSWWEEKGSLDVAIISLTSLILVAIILTTVIGERCMSCMSTRTQDFYYIWINFL